MAKEKSEIAKSAQAAPKSGSQGSVMKKSITIRLKRGTIACNPIQRATINGLGLKRRHQERTLENTPSVRGMIKKVLHLVEVVSEVR